MAANRQLRLFVGSRTERENERALAQGYNSPASASRFARSLFWDDIRAMGEDANLPAREFRRDGALRKAAYRWWLEDGGSRKRDAYTRVSVEQASGLTAQRARNGAWKYKRTGPPMAGYRKPLSSAANETLILARRRTSSMRFAIGDTQAHLPSYFRQLSKAGFTPKRKRRNL